MIRREIRRNNFNTNRNGGEESLFDPDDVSSVEIIRGGNSYDPELIDSIIVTYLDTSTDTITLMRGANPQVADTVPDYKYINNAMLSGFQVESLSEYDNRVVTCELVRENGYGKVVKVNLSYSN
ncbi:hypothetical protein IAQ67_29140 (plasmid) [Paenibacillus peoriae]|uniref:Uncharacterized protein n=2 Tax=Paenibacillus peoriae TaxID=59893 RepID=A0A7H0YH62_9BACL|nr:hypothetical protein IAQ67_29140 [Paenibacillus peoriae]